MENKIIKLLKELNVPMGNLGFGYLVTAIKEVAADEKKLSGITKDGGIYNIVAKVHGTTPTRAERAIRHGIECRFAKVSTATAEKHFGDIRIKPTNRNFIAALVYEIKAMEE